MSLDILLKDTELSDKISLSRDQYKTVLQSQRSILKSVFGSDTSDSVRLADKASLLFAGVYGVVKQKLATNSISQKQLRPSTQNAYALYVASEAIVQNVNFDISSYDYPSYMEQNYSKYLEFELNDFNVVSKSLSGFQDYAKNHRIYSDVEFMLSHYYSRLSDSIINHIYRVDSNSINALNDIKVVGNGFNVGNLNSNTGDTPSDIQVNDKTFRIEDLNGLKKPMQDLSNTLRSYNSNKSRSSGSTRKDAFSDKEFMIDPPEVFIKKNLTFDDIIGNDDSKEAIRQNIFKLMAYDFSERKNPFMNDGARFTKAINLIGLPGGGKTLLLDAAQCYAESISKKFDIPYNCVRLDFNNSYQDGPAQILDHQLKVISNPEHIYLVFVDEADKRFPAAKGINASGSERKTTGMIQEFLNGKSYESYGNYLMIFATNAPAEMNPALNSRLSGSTYVCKGPVTAQQKEQVLHLHLASAEKIGYLKVSNWPILGKVAYELNMSGRELAKVAEGVEMRSMINHYPDDFFKLDYLKKQELIASKHQPIYQETVVQELYRVAQTRKSVRDVTDEFNSI
ncbi:MAG: AAA family ATPase [Candidatus Woesearchaeota archaeon]